MIDEKPTPKKHKLKMDEFASSEWSSGFWRLPHGIAALRTLLPGAKLLYATLFVLASKHNAAFASKEYLQQCLGYPCLKTLYLWQKQLENEGLIRVLQKGRGQPNNYYLLRHPALGNAEEAEFQPGARPLYRDRQHGTQTIVTEEEGQSIFEDRLREWCEESIRGGFVEFPKPGIKIKAEKRRELESKWQKRYTDAVIAGTAKLSLPSNATTCPSTSFVPDSTSQGSADYDAVFSDSGTNTQYEDAALKLSNTPSEFTLPSGKVIHGPSSRECYLAAMKLRKQ